MFLKRHVLIEKINVLKLLKKLTEKYLKKKTWTYPIIKDMVENHQKLLVNQGVRYALVFFNKLYLIISSILILNYLHLNVSQSKNKL